MDTAEETNDSTLIEATTLEKVLAEEGIDLEAEAAELESKKVMTDQSLNRVRDLVREQIELELKITEIATTLKEKNARLDEISTKLLPDLFRELDLSSFELNSGMTVEIATKYYGSISVANAQPAFKFLREFGAGDMIKNEVKIEFGRGDDSVARKFFRDLRRRKQQLAFTEKTFVHPQTLGAFVCEQYEAGRSLDLPTDILGIHVERVAQIKTPVTKKRRS